MKILAIAFALAAGFLAAAHAGQPATIQPSAVPAWIKATPAAQILDVRTKEEFATGHLAKAVLIPWTDSDFKARVVKELDKEKPVLVYCRSGRRSAEAAAAMVKLGFKDVRNLEGGVIKWTKDGQALVTPTPDGHP